MISIRLVEDQAEFDLISQFRYKVYVEEMKRKQTYADHAKKIIVDPLDCDGVINIAAWHENKVVGVVRTNLLRQTDAGEYLDMYNLSDFSDSCLSQMSITTRLMVDIHHRNGALAVRLAKFALVQLLTRNIISDFIDCNSHLVPFFSKLGYRVHRPNLTHPQYGAVTVMRLDLNDLAYMEHIRSPFLKILHMWNENHTQTIKKDSNYE